MGTMKLGSSRARITSSWAVFMWQTLSQCSLLGNPRLWLSSTSCNLLKKPDWRIRYTIFSCELHCAEGYATDKAPTPQMVNWRLDWFLWIMGFMGILATTVSIEVCIVRESNILIDKYEMKYGVQPYSKIF